ncbi:MAG: sensor histidine kinase [Flavobacteriales bacterium]|nr:sensor histidine kinase [Flavobacteriales bacterium]
MRDASARGDTAMLTGLHAEAVARGDQEGHQQALLARAIAAYRKDDFLRCGALCDSLLRSPLDPGPLRSIASRFQSMVSTGFSNARQAVLLAEHGLAGLDTAAFPIDAADLLVVLAEAHLEEGDMEAALHALKRADGIASARNYQRGLALVEFSLGSMSFMQGRFGPAQQQYRSALRMATQGGYDVLAQNAATNLALASSQAGDPEAASLVFDSLLASLGSANPALRAWLHHSQAMIEIDAKDFGSALKRCERALPICDSVGFEIGKVKLLAIMGVSVEGLGDSRRAIELYQQALDLARSRSMHDEALSMHWSLHQANRRIGEQEGAYVHLMAYTQLSDSLKGARFNERMAYEQVRFDTERKERRIAEQEQRLELAAAEDRRKALQRNLSLALTFVLLVAAALLWRTLLVRRRLAAKERELHLNQVDQMIAQHDARSVAALMEVQERTQKRIAADLHDQMGGAFATIRMQLEGLEARMPAVGATEQYAMVKNLIHGAGDELRRVSHELAEGPLADRGLQHALIELRDAVNKSGMVQVELRARNLEHRMKRQEETTAYRIVQELVTNALKHARAARITIDAERQEDELLISVSDDGVGFDPTSSSGGLGMGNLQARVAELGGELHLESAPGKGTQARARFPLAG